MPQDLDEIVPDVDQAYADALKKLGASYMLAGATEPRARESTMEIRLAEPAAGVPQCLPEPRYLKSSSVPARTRTWGLLLRRQSLYPSELRGPVHRG